MIVANRPLLDAFAAKLQCEWCRAAVEACDPAHIYTVGAGRVDIPGNLCALCRRCHDSSHDGNEPTIQQLLAVAARRERMLPSTITRVVQEIRRWPKEKPLPANLRRYLTSKPMSAPAPAGRLILEIPDVKGKMHLYLVTRIDVDRRVRVVGWDLLKDGLTTYHVSRHKAHGNECTCPDFAARRQGVDREGCKHIKALVAARLLPQEAA